jgi:hypothetical protein
MSLVYIAFGLEIHCGFELPGMRPRQATGFPALRLDLVEPELLRTPWSGSLGGRPWRGGLGDGTELTIERGRAGDLLIVNGDRVAFHLDSAATCLRCAPRDPGGLAWKRILLSRVLAHASIGRGREALHASAIDSPLGVVAFAAPSGTGKSTLAAELNRRGWPQFTDDVLILSADHGGLRAFPGTPHITLSTSCIGAELLGETLDVFAGEAWMAVSAAASESRPLAAVFLPRRGPGLELRTRRLDPSPLALAPYMLGLPDEPGGEDRRFSVYSDLVDSAMLIELTAGADDPPGRIADAVERALALVPAATTGGAIP